MRLRDYQQEALDVTLKKFEDIDTDIAVIAARVGDIVSFVPLAKRVLRHGKVMAIVHGRQEFAKRKEVYTNA